MCRTARAWRGHDRCQCIYRKSDLREIHLPLKGAVCSSAESRKDHKLFFSLTVDCNRKYGQFYGLSGNRITENPMSYCFHYRRGNMQRINSISRGFTSILFPVLLGALALLACGDSNGGTGPSGGSGNAYYVSPAGDDDNDGTLNSPWETITKAAQTLSAGDTVYVRTGTYSERVVPQNSGSSSNVRIVYTAYSGETPVIDGTGVTLPTGMAGLVELSGVSHIVFSGFTVRDAGTEDNHCGILLDDCSAVTVSNCYIYNTVSSGIGVWGCSSITLTGNEVELACNDGEQECITVAGTDVFTVSNNHVHNSGPGSIGGEGIDIKDGSSVGSVFGNTVHDINRIGIYIDSWDKQTDIIDVYGNLVYNTTDDGFALAAEAGGLLTNISVYNNIAYGNTNSGLTVASWGEPVPSHPMSNIIIINNTFYGNGSAGWGVGISVENSDADNLTIRNNILSQNLFAQILVEEVGTGLQVDHNVFHGTGTPYGSDYVTDDPALVNPSGGDFHLQSTSPAIDTGSSSGAPSDDFEGNPRPNGSGYDMGAYEY